MVRNSPFHLSDTSSSNQSYRTYLGPNPHKHRDQRAKERVVHTPQPERPYPHTRRQQQESSIPGNGDLGRTPILAEGV